MDHVVARAAATYSEVHRSGMARALQVVARACVLQVDRGLQVEAERKGAKLSLFPLEDYGIPSAAQTGRTGMEICSSVRPLGI